VPADDERDKVLQRVRTLLGEGFLKLPTGVTAEIQAPLPVHGPDGRIHSWMVPFVREGKLVAWAQISPSLTFLRFSVLAGGRIQEIPDAADWLDSKRIALRIAEAAGTGDVLGPPILTYDRDPSRLVWAAEIKTLGGKRQRWLAAGTSAWQDTASEEVTGGPPSGP
jgi:hypothetical protein